MRERRVATIGLTLFAATFVGCFFLPKQSVWGVLDIAVMLVAFFGACYYREPRRSASTKRPRKKQPGPDVVQIRPKAQAAYLAEIDAKRAELTRRNEEYRAGDGWPFNYD